LSGIAVRLGEPDDWAAAVEIWRLADEARRQRPLTADQIARTAALATNPDAFFVVAEDGDAMVAMSLAVPAREADGAGPGTIPGLVHIAMVFVHPDRWGQRIGEAVVDRILDEAWARDYSEAQLWTDADNTRAHALYERIGWRRSGHEKENDDGRPIVRYERSL
jgi:GNAT superfamily N-acetyltransferase